MKTKELPVFVWKGVYWYPIKLIHIEIRMIWISEKNVVYLNQNSMKFYKVKEHADQYRIYRPFLSILIRNELYTKLKSVS